MKIQVSDFVNVKAKAEALGCNIPTAITVMPYEFENAQSKSALCYEGAAQTLKRLFQDNGITQTPLEQEGEEFPSLLKESSVEEWIGPTVFVSFTLLSQNPNLISIALNVISNYLTDWFKGSGNKFILLNKATLDLVVELKNGDCKKLHYEGTGSDLGQVADVVRELCLHN